MSARNEVRRQARRRAGVAWRFGAIAGLCALSITPAWTQASPELRQILERLDRLEAQNQALTAEVHALREELAARGGQPVPEQAAEAAAPTVEERLEVQETRTAEQAETKMESAHRLPFRISGMALLNTYFNTNGGGGGAQYPTTVVAGQPPSGGASFRQSIVGLDYSGPQTFGDGKISGSLRLDLFGGTAANQYVRLRTASLSIDWKTSSFTVGLEKPLISQREPDSLAQVGISPLSGAGNLWYWIPQARFTQDFQFGAQSGMRAQIGVVQTHEVDGSALGPYETASPSSVYFEPARPGVEARLEFFHGSDRRIEIAPGLHHSVSHVEGASVPSDIYSLDWFTRPWRLLEFTGEAFAGQNVAPLGTGGLRQGIVVTRFGSAKPVHSLGGWGQFTVHAAPRLWFNVFSGQQDDRNSDLPAGGVGKNLAYGSNVFFRLAPNVLTSFEASQTRTSYIGSQTLRSNHYDLAFAYLF
ncbi:MAG: hypothetical protein ABSC23_06800 [Bryobacteraceae bacterium]